MKNRVLLVLFLLPSFIGFSQNSDKDRGLQAVTIDAVKGQLEFLASDWTEGRETGKKGIFMASDYIVSMFKVYGIQPGGDDEWTYPSRAERREGKRPEKFRTYFQNISFVNYKPGDEQILSIITVDKGTNKTLNLSYETDFSFRVSDIAQEFEADVVFVGYGMKSDKNNYNDFKGIDVKGKVILRLSGYPGHNNPGSDTDKKFKPEGRYAMWYMSREKNELAQELGAVGVIEISSDSEPEAYWAKNVPFRYNLRMWEGERKQESPYEFRTRLPGKELSSNLINISLSKRAFNELIKGQGIDVEKIEKLIKTQLKPVSKELKGKRIYLKSSVDSKIIKCRNVVGMIEGKNKDEIIVIGAHYDHQGIHDGFIWNGADDNASGTVGVMTIARAFALSGVQPEKTIVFAAWTAEEKGLLGSRYFAENPYDPDKKIILNLNYDMISRDNDTDTLGNQCSMQYTKGYEILEELAKKHITDYKLALDVKFRSSEKPSGGSDHSSFSRKDIPIFYFMAGFPEEYHQPDDHVELVNWEKLTNIIKLGYLNVWEIAMSKEAFIKK